MIPLNCSVRLLLPDDVAARWLAEYDAEFGTKTKPGSPEALKILTGRVSECLGEMLAECKATITPQ